MLNAIGANAKLPDNLGAGIPPAPEPVAPIRAQSIPLVDLAILYAPDVADIREQENTGIDTMHMELIEVAMEELNDDIKKHRKRKPSKPQYPDQNHVFSMIV